MYFDSNQYTYAIVTSTTYGTWLPGEERGFVDDEHNQFNTPFLRDEPELKRYSQKMMSEPIVYFQREHAEIVLNRWLEIIGEYHWFLFVVAIMSNHFHLVVAAPGKIAKETLLRNFKSRAAKKLNDRFGKRTWWTISGSVRFCFNEKALSARIDYVKRQKNPLVVWTNPQEFTSQ